MIPDFDDNDYLPAGIHAASLEEIAVRFGYEPELRRVQMESLHWLVDLAKRVGVRRIIVNGSFVTDKWEPNDVDCVLLRAETISTRRFRRRRALGGTAIHSNGSGGTKRIRSLHRGDLCHGSARDCERSH
jgi:hypothetical protein